jgi:hypothetical protein
MLDDADVRINETGDIGVAYFSQRLLSKQPSLSPRLDNIRDIASRFARDDADADTTIDRTERYREHILALSSLLVNQGSLRVYQLFIPDPWALKLNILNYDLLTATVYLGKLSVVEDLGDQEKNMKVTIGTFNNPYTVAALKGDCVIIDTLFQKANIHHLHTLIDIVLYQLRAASSAGLASTVEHILALDWDLKPRWQHVCTWEAFDTVLSSPSVETFRIVKRLKEEMTGKPVTTELLATLLLKAAEQGWEGMAAHLLEMGAPTDGDCFGNSGKNVPLLAACESGSEGVVRLLLRHYAPITDPMIGEAAKKGRLGTVRALLEHGADIKLAIPPPIVSAVELEHKELFLLLLEHGADLELTGPIAMKKAREAGLESMLELLEQYGVKEEVEPKFTD